MRGLCVSVRVSFPGGHEQGHVAREGDMATYIELVSWTDQGVRNAKDTVSRAKAFEEAAGAVGVKVKSLFWTLGEYDLVITVEAPDDEVVTRVNLMLAQLGNVRTKTLRAFNADEMTRITAGLK